MAKFIMFGNYSAEAVKGISAGRTAAAEDKIKELGGNIDAMYAALGEQDLVLIVDLPDVQKAMQASLSLSKLTGISFKTAPAVEVADFDKLIEGI